MAENYVVNYDINVRSQKALESIRKFQEATNNLEAVGKKLTAFQKKIESVTAKFSQMTKKAPVLDISTSKVNKKLNNVITKLETIHKLAKKSATLNVNTAAKTVNKAPVTPAPSVARKPGTRLERMVPRNVGYRNLGPSMIDSGGIGAFDMVKGMGIAYGIAGLGSLMGNVLQQASEYDNIMKTTKNILGTHDKLPGFERRFQDMEHLVRNVGIETKFTAPQVADASKFLAMAGFDLDAINKSVRPIADIALVGDTELGETADVVTNIMTGYGIKPEKVRKAADIMTMTFTKSNTTLMEIAEAYKYSASLLSAGGVSFEEATAGLGILGDAGIKGSQAGTTMRTIMANIVNPTKKQLAQWKQVGVERTDKEGNIRPLVNIFKDLNNADLGVSDYYKIFHKTAAQGAVSLAENVDKWNEIIRLNFLSDGIVSSLAKEKKNTVKGLWYQLTSSITEDGMKVFEEMQQPIKEFLQQTIDWFKTPAAVSTIKDISLVVFEMVGVLKDFAIWCTKIYNMFDWFIKPWLKFQVYALPFLTFFRSLRALGNAGMFFVGIAVSISKITGSVIALTKSLKGLWQFGLLNIFGKLFKETKSAAQTNTLSKLNQLMGIPDIVEGKNTAKGKGKRKGKGKGKQVIQKQPKTSAVVSTPKVSLGWVAGITGATALGYAIYDTIQYYNDLGKAYDKWYEKVYATKGYLSEGLSPTEKYLKLVHDKQLSVNQKVDEYIRLRREQMGLESEAATELSGKTIGEAYSPILDKLKDKPWYSFLLPGASNQASAWDNGQTALAYLPENIRKAYNYESYTNPSGNVSDFITKNGNTYSAKNFTRDMFAATIGYDFPAAKDIIEEFTATLKKSPIEKWQDVYNILNARIQKYKDQVDPSYANLSLDEIKRMSANDILKIPMAFDSFNNRIQEAMFNYNGSNENARMLSALKDLLSNKGDWSIEQQAKFLKESGVGLFSDRNGYTAGSEEWEKQFGFDRKTNKFTDFGDKMSNKWAQDVSIAMSHVAEVINTMSQDAIKKFTVLSSPMAVAAWSQNQLNSDEEVKIGTQRYINGILHEWNIQAPEKEASWHPVKNAPDLQPLGGGNGANGGATGTNQSNYKSHYKSDTAVPKQIIVKIENLMNVESVDLSNPDKAAVIADLKGEMAQALIDVVHDFNESFHG